ncbi:MAG: site-specific integrase [Candidatus Bathyarchaeia archaeon]|jgi:integrase
MNHKLVKELLKQLQQETQDPKDIGNLNIAKIIIWMKKDAYEPTNIQRVIKELKHLQKNCNVSNPQEVKLYIANKNVSNARKENLIESYNIAIQSLGLSWNKPFYQRQDKKRRAPKEESVQFILNHVKIPLNLKLKMSRDLGERPIELTWLKVQDIDLVTGRTDLTGAKHKIGREGKLKQDTLELLKRYIKRENLNPQSILFPTTLDVLSTCYRHARNNLAEEYNMPELKQVQLYDLRRRKGTGTYKLSGNNFLKVKKILGHKDARSTEKYITEDESIEWEPIKAVSDEEKANCFAKDYQFMANDSGVFWFRKPKNNHSLA